MSTLHLTKSLKLTGLLLLVLLMMACNLASGGPTPAPTPDFSLPTLIPQPIPSNTSVPLPTEVPTFTPLPSPTNTVVIPTNTSWPDLVTYDNAAQAYRLSFQPGWTWMQITDDTTIGYTTPNGSKRYVLSAMKGQVMSISVPQSWPFTIEIADRNGPLTDSQYYRPFWHGVLPSTGDYFITVNTQTSGAFNLRVAINAPGQAKQYFNYTSSQPAFSLNYSDEFAPTTNIPAGNYKGSPVFTLDFIRTEFYGPTTNLGEAYFMVNTYSDTETCIQPVVPNESNLGQETVNGNTFTVSRGVGVGAGNIYDLIMYRSVIKNTCYEIVFFMHYSNIGNYTPGTVVEFDRESLVQKFEEVLSTFTVK